MQNQKLEGVIKGQKDMEEVHYGGEGPHWAVVPMKKIIIIIIIIICITYSIAQQPLKNFNRPLIQLQLHLFLLEAE